MQPPSLDVPPDQRSAVELSIRYEDVAQDGRLKLTALPHALGVACWRELLADHPISALARDEGVLPILSRVRMSGGEGPVSPLAPIEAHGRYRLGHTRDAAGAVTRLTLELFAEVFGARARTHGPAPEGAGERIPLGTIHAEHVFTRPFADASERKVSRLPDAICPGGVPEFRYPWRSPESVRVPPRTAKLLDAEPSSAGEVVFGLMHTDVNQHVNSLAYPHVVEQAALDRFAARGLPTEVLATRMDLAYRQPCFAGQKVELSLMLYDVEGRRGAVGAFEGVGRRGRPRVYARVEF